jgi:hypothetical protein
MASRELYFNDLWKRATEMLPMMPTAGNEEAETFDIIDLRFLDLEDDLEQEDENKVANTLAEMVCWMVILREERALKKLKLMSSTTEPKSRAGHHIKPREEIVA